MAETDNMQSRERVATPNDPVLRRGRPADALPAQAPVRPVAATASAPEAEFTEAPPGNAVAASQGESSDRPSAEEPQAEPIADDAPATTDHEHTASRQRWLRQLLRQCDRVLLLDFDLLAMPEWPDSYTLAAARRNRDLWLFSVTLAALIFLSGMSGFVPAWVAGGGFGAGVLMALAGVPGIRRLFTSRMSHIELVMLRRRLLQDARKHIAHLEGKSGLVWQCARMAEFNPAVRSSRFTGLINLSERRVLARALVRREHIRMYLIYLLEAEKAYGRLENAYFEGHQQAIDQGWESAAGAPASREA
ncbi:hypothetical protein [Marinobacter sp.]|uniref:hypothetical protein n=1 Tax=Marinobacter sp. TaxID=50741 RepID=UPI0038510709